MFIGYTPYNTNLNVPGDRRRFIFYAHEKNLKFEIANPNVTYDVIYVTYGSDISTWINYKIKNPTVKLIFELIDSYVFESLSFKTLFRGSIRYLQNKESKFWFNYKSALFKIITLADAIVCSSIIQKNFLLKYNKNIHISLDYFTNDIKKKSHMII